MGIEMIKNEDNLTYARFYSESHTPDTYVGYIRGKRCINEDAFFHEISAAFQFPSYFGENWAAMDECLGDLDWLVFKRVVMIIDDFDQVFNEQHGIKNELQITLLRYLKTFIDSWAAESIEARVILISN